MSSSGRKRRNSQDLHLNFATDPPSSQSEEMVGPKRSKWDPSKRGFRKYMTKNCKINDGPPAQYQLKTKRVNLDRLSDEESKLRRFTLGKRNPSFPNKTILLVGETGAGKSTLINALVNFVMGVKLEDNVWFEMVKQEKNRPQSESQTSAVSVYEVFGFEGVTVPYSLTIIDTPGYGHTEGIKHDEIITKKLQDLFCIPEGVDNIDAVGLVLKATVNRLDVRMAYIFNSVTSLFGKDMEKNIVLMMTHSDGEQPENALKALEDAKVKCATNQNNEPLYFLFNNRQNKKHKNNRAAQFAFETSEEGMRNFTEFLGQCQLQSLKTTAKVLKERIRLTASIQNLKERVKTIEVKQDVIRKNREEVIKYEKEMKNNKNFAIQVEETYKVRERIVAWWDTKAVSCLTCKETCHYPGCTWAWSPNWCEVMKNGRCTSCSGKCPVKDHVKEKWRYVTRSRKVKKTIAKIKGKYDQNKAKGKKKTTLLGVMKKEIAVLEQAKTLCQNKTFKMIEELDMTAVSVGSLSI